LGVLTKTPGQNAAIAGVIAGAMVMLFVKFETKIPFTWWVLIGSAVTFGVGWLASFAEKSFAEKDLARNGVARDD
jgi:hypothetical protein